MRTLGLLFKLTFVVSILLVITLAVLVFMAVQDYPLVSSGQPLTATEISRVKRLLQQNDPTANNRQQHRQLQISEQDLNLVLRYFSHKTRHQIRAKTVILPSSIFVQTSLNLVNNPFGEFINIATEFEQSDQVFRVKSMDIGELTLPPLLANMLFNFIHAELQLRYSEYQAVITAIDNIQLQQHGLSIAYTWQPELAHRIKDSLSSRLMSQQQKDMFQAYHNQLAMVITHIRDTRPSLNLLLKPMFSYAAERSIGSDPIMENRTLLITLGAYMLNKNIPEILGAHASVPVPGKQFYLLGRNDLSKHLIISSALTAMADSSFAHAIGLDKELSDSAGGSGFSFGDLTADRAGVALANLALSTHDNARIMQTRLAALLSESDYMPDIQQMPEGLQQLDFRLLYRNTDSPEYKQVIAEIDRRIAACSMYN